MHTEVAVDWAAVPDRGAAVCIQGDQVGRPSVFPDLVAGLARVESSGGRAVRALAFPVVSRSSVYRDDCRGGQLRQIALGLVADSARWALVLAHRSKM
jgi:hypothetical protein